ncbi:hypothetical protein AB0L40_09370 [Patulibacter sp. NPDC049589]|uniref:hypothetical protein n=1 Tax=Patulibacter sp. NPDC049589 TaxID=3154731 RepID=UPI00344286E4
MATVGEHHLADRLRAEWGRFLRGGDRTHAQPDQAADTSRYGISRFGLYSNPTLDREIDDLKQRIADLERRLQ